jgi:O-antigen/teichoic acid export membrane protein
MPEPTSNSLLTRLRGLLGGAVGGGAMLMISMTVVNGGNYLYNLVLGRMLGPAAFSDLSLMVTLMLMVTFVTVTLQMVAAKFAAGHTADDAPEATAALRRDLGRFSGLAGLALAIVLAGGAPIWRSFFHTESAWPFVLLAVGMPLYLLQGVDRGVLQGQIRFLRLSATYQVEMWVRLVLGIGLVWLGFGVEGAVLALSLSFIATWWSARSAGQGLPAAKPMPRAERAAVSAFARPVVVAQMGQILINNSDILIVKHFYARVPAGEYAALALIGRVVFFATWSVVTTLFPIVAQRHRSGQAHRHLLWLSLGLVGGGSALIVAGAWRYPEQVVGLLFGEAYLGIAPLLWRYAVATALFALSNVVIQYRLSSDRGAGSLIGLLGGGIQVAGLWWMHDSLAQVVNVQVAIMGGLLVALLVWDGLLQRSEAVARPQAAP